MGSVPVGSGGMVSMVDVAGLWGWCTGIIDIPVREVPNDFTPRVDSPGFVDFLLGDF